MKMNFSKNQNRREFLASSGRKGLTTALGFFGISLVNKNLLADDGKKCPENLNCRDCYKMGVCEEKIAAETRKEVKTNCYKTKVSKGASHG